MGSWYGTKIGFKVKPEDEELAQEFLMLLGVNMAGCIDEEIGELNNLGAYSVDGVIEGDLLGIMPALEKKFVDYQNQFYPPDEEDKDVEEDVEAESGFQLDDLYLTAKSLFTRPGMYLAHEDGNSVSDTYYRYEVLYSGVTKTEFNCFYSYGDDINVDTDSPSEEGTEETEEKLKAKKPDSNFVKMLIEKAEAEGYDDLVQRLKGEADKPATAVSKGKKEEIKKIPGLKVAKGIIIEYTGQKKELEIPKGITEIGKEAFSCCMNLKNIVLPESLEKIGEQAFRACRNLSGLEIPKNVTRIASEAFWKCEKLKEITVPEGVTSIEEGTFKECNGLQRVILQPGLEVIGKRAFHRCAKLSAVVLPGSIRVIGERAFDSCEKLSEIKLPASIRVIGENAFYWCTSLKEMILPEGLAEIGREAFYLCTGLKKLIIPESVTSIGYCAFKCCKGLKEAVVPKALEQVVKENMVFDDCEKLTDIQFV